MRNLLHQKFGRLSVIGEAGRTKTKNVIWECLCECSNIVNVASSHLVSGHTNSCGCYKRQRVLGGITKHGQSMVGKVTSEYKTWSHIKSRCCTKTDAKYPDYGGRGIMVCDRWLESFENFFADMGKKPSPKHSLDRIDNDGNYEPSNCRWGTVEQQSRNKRSNVWLEYKGEKMIMADWAKRLNIRSVDIRWHFSKGKSFKQVVEFYLLKMQKEFTAQYTLFYPPINDHIFRFALN